MSNITKIIKFYQFEPQPSLVNNGITPISTIQLLNSVFSVDGSYKVNYDKNQYIIDILNIGSDFVFGKCAEENELSVINFYQTRDKHTNQTIPYSSVSPDTQLEVYTFFYIDCTQNRMSAIQHKSLSKLHYILAQSIWELSGNTLSVFVAPERIKNIKQTVKKIKHNKKLAISFAPNAISKYNIDPLSKELGGIKYDSFSIEIKLSSTTSNTEINHIYDNFQNNKEAFNSLKLIGKTDSGFEETVDFIETLFTHYTTFEISEDIIKSYNIIKKKLAESLLIKQ